jgi:hypothetical protein
MLPKKEKKEKSRKEKKKTNEKNIIPRKRQIQGRDSKIFSIKYLPKS